MPQEGIWGWCPETKKWVKLRLDDDGSIHVVGYVDLLSDIGDVTVAGIADGMGIYWDDATSTWKVKQFLPLAGGTLTGALIIDDETYIQLGVDDLNLLHIIPWQEAGVGGMLLKPGAGNRMGFLAIQPKGTEDKSQLSLYNVEPPLGTDYGAFSIKIDGAAVAIIFENVGTPATPVTELQLLNNWKTKSFEPTTDTIGSLGTTAKRYENVVGLHHQITQALAVDHYWSGITAPMTAGAALTRTQAVYVGGDSKMELAKADAAATMPAIALATGSIAENAEGEFLLKGYFRDNTWDWTPGGLLYVSKDTAGALTHTKPTGSGEQAQPVGVAITADIIYFCPQGIEAVAAADGATKEFFVPVTDLHTTGELLLYETFTYIELRTGEYVHFTFKCPHDFTSLTHCKVIGIKGTSSNLDWTATTKFGAEGEDFDTHSDSATADNVALTDDKIEGIDIAAALTGLAAGDYVGVKFKADTVDTAYWRVIGLVFKYS